MMTQPKSEYTNTIGIHRVQNNLFFCVDIIDVKSYTYV